MDEENMEARLALVHEIMHFYQQCSTLSGIRLSYHTFAFLNFFLDLLPVAISQNSGYLPIPLIKWIDDNYGKLDRKGNAIALMLSSASEDLEYRFGSIYDNVISWKASFYEAEYESLNRRALVMEYSTRRPCILGAFAIREGLSKFIEYLYIQNNYDKQLAQERYWSDMNDPKLSRYFLAYQLVSAVFQESVPIDIFILLCELSLDYDVIVYNAKNLSEKEEMISRRLGMDYVDYGSKYVGRLLEKYNLTEMDDQIVRNYDYDFSPGVILKDLASFLKENDLLRRKTNLKEIAHECLKVIFRRFNIESGNWGELLDRTQHGIEKSNSAEPDNIFENYLLNIGRAFDFRKAIIKDFDSSFFLHFANPSFLRPALSHIPMIFYYDRQQIYKHLGVRYLNLMSFLLPIIIDSVCSHDIRCIWEDMPGLCTFLEKKLNCISNVSNYDQSPKYNCNYYYFLKDFFNEQLGVKGFIGNGWKVDL
jgi:hypothetical protein